jgi:hypothetical protein
MEGYMGGLNISTGFIWEREPGEGVASKRARAHCCWGRYRGSWQRSTRKVTKGCCCWATKGGRVSGPLMAALTVNPNSQHYHGSLAYCTTCQALANEMWEDMMWKWGRPLPGSCLKIEHPTGSELFLGFAHHSSGARAACVPSCLHE